MTDSRPVLVLMDLQNGIVERVGGAELLANARRALDAARAHGIPVVFVRVAFREGYPEVAPSNLAFGAIASRGDSMTEAHDATQLHATLERRPEEPIVTKRRISAFSGSDLDVILRGAQADSLILGGVSTSGVVLSTIRQAADLDYRLTVLADVVADADPEVHDVLMQKVFPRQAAVTTADAWIASLDD